MGKRILDAGHVASSCPLAPPDDVASLAGWLLDHMDQIRVHEAADDFFRDVTWWADDRRLVMVDRPAESWYAGRCDCETELYAKPGSSRIFCKGCGQAWDVQARRQWLIEAAKDYLLTATEAADALGAWGMGVKPERIRKWAERKRLLKRGVTVGLNGRDLPTYRLGDVIDLLAREAQRENEKRAS
jgi:hypothetical protein